MNLISFKNTNEIPETLSISTKTRLGLIIYSQVVLQVAIHITRLHIRQSLVTKLKLRFNKPTIQISRGKVTHPLRVNQFQKFKYVRHLEVFAVPTTLFKYKIFGLVVKYRMRLRTYERICYHIGINSVKELQSSKFLKSLTLYFDKSSYLVSNSQILNFKKALVSMKGLTALSIILQESPFTMGRQFGILHECKHTMTKLKKITFVIPYFQVVTPFLIGLKEFLTTHPNIEIVNLNYEGDEVSESDHLLMMSSILELKGLRKTHIGYNWCALTFCYRATNYIF